ncbi:MAG: nicotinamide-nucleotide amidohydrolase family protein, partial [Alicyclobacillus sp.]|nr:nicotinamide-nucleotide amidohydrolase family protein [Alicyclobacillus sp.]
RQQFRPYIYGVDEDSLASVTGRLLQARHAWLAVAESCTGGVLSSMMTAVPGSSAYFRGSVVAYHNEVKQGVLGVPATVLERCGAVSAEVAEAMAAGVRRALGAEYGIATTGVAGPGGGSAEKPVGLVYTAVAGPQGTRVYPLQLRGSRQQIQIRASKHVLWRLWQQLAADGAGAGEESEG